MANPRLDIAALERRLLSGDLHNPTRGLHRDTTARVAKWLGVSRSTLMRLRVSGLDVWRADELAVRVNLHPADVWPEWDLLIDEAIEHELTPALF